MSQSMTRANRQQYSLYNGEALIGSDLKKGVLMGSRDYELAAYFSSEAALATRINVRAGFCNLNNTASDLFATLILNETRVTLPPRPNRPALFTRKPWYKTVDLTALYFLEAPTANPTPELAQASQKLATIRTGELRTMHVTDSQGVILVPDADYGELIAKVTKDRACLNYGGNQVVCECVFDTVALNAVFPTLMFQVGQPELNHTITIEPMYYVKPYGYGRSAARDSGTCHLLINRQRSPLKINEWSLGSILAQKYLVSVDLQYGLIGLAGPGMACNAWTDVFLPVIWNTNGTEATLANGTVVNATQPTYTDPNADGTSKTNGTSSSSTNS